MSMKFDKTDLSPDELKKMRRASVIKMAIMGVVIALVIAFGSIAWFTMNREVEGTGTKMTANDLPFEIAAHGTNGVRNLSDFQTAAKEFLAGESYTFGSGDDAVTYSKTGTGTDCIRLQCSTGDSEVGPGGNGICDLYVIPYHDGDLSVKISMNVIAFAYVDVYDLDKNGHKIPSKDENDDPILDELGNPVYETTSQLMRVSEINTADCKITEPEIVDLLYYQNLLQGHILFFEEEGSLTAENDDDKFSYKKPLTNRTLIYTEQDAEAGKPFYVPIRWMWPNTLGQLALQTNANDLRSGIPVVKQEAATSSNDKGKILSYLKTNQDAVFKDIDSSKLSTVQKAEYAALSTDAEKTAYLKAAVNSWIDSADNPTYFEILSDGYNYADYAIGSNIAYFLVELTVTEAGSQ